MSVGGDLPSGCCPEPDFTGIETSLDVGFGAVVEALDQINETLSGKQKDCQKIIDDCGQDIIDLIGGHYRTYTKSCDECKSMLNAGLGGTIEYAVACAGACISETKIPPNPCAQSPAGTPCSACGQSPCCCDENEQCVPCEQPSAHKYIGWCDFAGGETIVTAGTDPPPGPTFTAVAYGDEESVVFDEALNTCKTYQPPLPENKYGPPAMDLGSVYDLCSIQAYLGGANLSAIVSAGGSAFTVAGHAEAWGAAAKFGIEGINLGNFGELAAGIHASQYSTPPFAAHNMLPKIAGAVGCNNPTWIAGLEVQVAIGMVEKFTGARISEYAAPIDYALNASCRRKFLEPKEALDAYLAHAFEYVHFDAHCAIAGLCSDATKEMEIAAKAKLEPEQLVQLHHRDLIGDDEYAAGFRQLGYVDDGLQWKILAIAEHLPDIATVVRMAQQGAGNDGEVAKLGLDRGLSELMGGQYHAWLHGNGLSDETIKRFWRAHWTTPNIANLFEFWHRLRDSDEFNAGGKLGSDIRSALDNLGITPYWQEHFWAVSLQPLLKRDIRAAYTSGALPQDELVSALRVTGHDDHAVSVLVKELKPARRHAIVAHIAIRNWVKQQTSEFSCKADLEADGFDAGTIHTAMRDVEWEFEHSTWAEAFVKNTITREQLIGLLTGHGVTDGGANALGEKLSFRVVDHQAVKDYIAGSVSRSVASRMASNEGMRTEVVNKLLSDADQAIQNSFVLECQRGIHQRYLLGEIDRATAHDLLTGNNVDAVRANLLVSYYDCGKRAEGTKVSVEKLCHWLYIGTLSPNEFLARLHTLGYSEANALLLLDDCIKANTLKAIQQANRIVKENISAAEKQARAKAKSDAQQQLAERRLADARSKAAKLRAARDKQLLSAAEKVYANSSLDLAASIAAVRDSVSRGQATFGLSVDESLRTALLAADKVPKGKAEDYPAAYDVLAQAASESGLEPTVISVGGEPRVNGSTHPSP